MHRVLAGGNHVILSIRSIATFVALGLAVPGGVAWAEDASGAQECRRAPRQASHGFASLIDAGLSEVTLRADQEDAVRSVRDTINALQVRVNEARNAFFLAVADQVEAGKICRDRLDAQVERVVEACGEAAPTLLQSIQTLHGILDTTQRNDLADAIESGVHQMRPTSGTKLDKLAALLNLTQDQKARIRAAMDSFKAALEGHRAHVHRAIEALRADDFSAESVMSKCDIMTMARARLEQQINVAGVVTETLDSKQRSQLAKLMRLASHGRSRR